MLNEFRRRIHREMINYVIDMRTHTCGYLGVAHCFYKRDFKYYIATSYYTDFWIAKDPTGPKPNAVDMGKLTDIATVREFKDQTAMNTARNTLVKERELNAIIQEFCKAAQKQFGLLDKICDGDDTVSWAFAPVPVPTLTATFRSKANRVLGVVVFMAGSEPFVSFCGSDRLHDVYLPRCRQLWGMSQEYPTRRLSELNF